MKKLGNDAFRSKRKTLSSINDETVLISAQKKLEEDDVDPYEVSSITPLNDSETTTIIVDTGSANYSLEIDQHSGKIINKEKLVR